MGCVRTVFVMLIVLILFGTSAFLPRVRVEPDVEAMQRPPPVTILSFAWNADGTLLASGGIYDGQRALRIYDTNGQVVQQFDVESGPSGISWHPNGEQLSSVASDRNYTIWNKNTGQILHTFPQEASSGDDSLYWNPTDPNIVANAIADIVQVRDLNTGDVLQTLDRPGGLPDSVVGMGWSADGTKIYVHSTDNVIATWDVDNGTLENEIFPENGAISFVLSPDATRFAYFDRDGQIRVSDATTYEEVFVTEAISHEESYALRLVWHSDSNRIAGGSREGVHVWDITTGAYLYTHNQILDIFTVFDLNSEGLVTIPGADGNPVLSPIPQAEVSRVENGSKRVMLDASGSADSDGTIVNYSWQENGFEIATGVNPTVSLPIGEHTITLVVTDDDGATSTATVVITVE